MQLQPFKIKGFSQVLRQIQIYPTRSVVTSFVLVALIGSALLSLPAASRTTPLSWVDAMFTSTSAVCVTGLIVVDTGARFTPFGQIVIITLIQLGGLGIMTFSVVLAIFSGKRLSLTGRLVLEQTFLPHPETQIYNILKTIVGGTLIIESSGAILLYLFIPGDGFFNALFHSVSAFCNAGFSLYSDSFSSFRSHIGVNLVITSLIILGGLGFFVIFDVIHHFSSKESKKLSLHSKIVLSVTAGLITIGTIGFYLMESNNLLRSMTPVEGLLVSYFQSVTARTAGFNTVNLGQATNASLFFLIMLMWVGASPGSTGGGAKTTTLGVLLALAKSKLQGKEDVDIFHATISPQAVARALSVAILSLSIIGISLLALLWIQVGTVPMLDSKFRFIQFFFETTSAFGTVGLSTGITSSLSAAGKLILCAVMLTGRIGPLTIAHAVGRRFGKGKFRYAEEPVMIG